MFAKGPKSDGSFKTGLMVRRALRHESVHIAQECNGGNEIYQGKQSLKINSNKLNALEGSTNLTGERKKEIEAYALEDRPRKVISLLKEFCF